MSTRVTYPLVPLAAHSTASTYFRTFNTDAIGLTRGLFYLYVPAGGVSGSTPTLDCKVQGAPSNVSAMYTALGCWNLTGPVGGKLAFAQMTTAGVGVKYSEYIPPYMRVVSTLGGTSPSFTYGVYVAAVES